MSATHRTEPRAPRELPRGNVPVRVVFYDLPRAPAMHPRTAAPVRCGCGGVAARLVLDGGNTRFVCGGSKCL